MVLYPDFGHDDLPGQNDRLFDFLSAAPERSLDPPAVRSRG
jgi:hypothetical protein